MPKQTINDRDCLIEKTPKEHLLRRDRLSCKARLGLNIIFQQKNTE
jgi:hypothetical protein